MDTTETNTVDEDDTEVPAQIVVGTTKFGKRIFCNRIPGGYTVTAQFKLPKYMQGKFLSFENVKDVVHTYLTNTSHRYKTGKRSAKGRAE